jgi:hypothetical protein
MKRYNNLFDKIVSLDNLYLADKKARRNKSNRKRAISLCKKIFKIETLNKPYRYIVIISNGISSPLRFYSPFNLLGLYLIFIISYYL